MSPLSSVSRQERSSPVPGKESRSALEADKPDRSEGGMKRRLKNRYAARKSRKKQTEIADELHEEMQHLERSNATLLKEIGQLKKDVQAYETMLKNHEPFCYLRESESAALHFSHREQTPERPAPPASIPNDSPSPRDASSSSQETGLPLDLCDIANEHLLGFDKLPRDSGLPFFDSEGGSHGSFSTELSGPFPLTEGNNSTFSFLSTLFTTQASSPNSMLSTHCCTQQSLNTQYRPSTDLLTNFPIDHRQSSESLLTKTQPFNPEPNIPAPTLPLQALSCPTQAPSPQLSSSEAQPQ
ncbi:uncharacterized protein batf2 [Synchiropus picturatus]